VAVVLVIRSLETGQRTLSDAVGELVAFLIVTVLATWLLEGGLVREAVAYVVAGER